MYGKRADLCKFLDCLYDLSLYTCACHLNWSEILRLFWPQKSRSIRTSLNIFLFEVGFCSLHKSGSAGTAVSAGAAVNLLSVYVTFIFNGVH